ncbi:integral membrane protein-1 [Coleophoma crateriformis]|uniref:Integral membrane protein-1 n=1 Tax=Coleophoma crateriformis TaxID=565419 RepID=A0A3D8T0Y1_9HELO|nr:integral membrane protein-1 [Coleophoma crateriformis]
MRLTDILAFALRIGELAFAGTVAGLTGSYLHSINGTSNWLKKRFIYTEVIAGTAILFLLLFLCSFATSFIHWPIDLLLSTGFIIAFGLLAAFIRPIHCGSVWNWQGITAGSSSVCAKFKADLAFCFLASIFFLASAVLI